MEHKAQPRPRMDMQKAERLVGRANAARKRGRPDGKLESRFAVKCVESFAGVQLRVFRIDMCALPRELPLEPLANSTLDPFHPSFDMENFRKQQPLTEGIRK
ncbi:hypothetical protein JW721_01760 [Candidatus Micrarchaeota archaeon]|nr:hypothetical protein [Candidatus Micrarchaeota archaeon]